MADKMADNRLTALTAKNHQEYICECCNYKTLRLSEFNRHKNTAKHRRSEKITKITENEENKKWSYSKYSHNLCMDRVRVRSSICLRKSWSPCND